MKEKRKNLKSSWWNRIIGGKKSNSDLDNSVYLRKDVREEDLLVHDDYFNKLRVVYPILRALNKSQFSQDEFNIFVLIKYNLAKKQGDFRYYNRIWNLVYMGITLRDSFEKIAQIESNYHLEKEQQFYQDTTQILETTCDSNIFYNTILHKFNAIYRSLDHESTQKALMTYQQECQKISRYGQSGLEVFLLHKKSQYSYINTFPLLAELIENICHNIKQINNKHWLLDNINNNYHIFSELNYFLKIRETYQDYPHYLLLLQYLALNHQYKRDYQEFKIFLKSLQEWNKYYQTILELRDKYPIADYKQPASFLQEISGEEIYTKYKKYLP